MQFRLLPTGEALPLLVCCASEFSDRVYSILTKPGQVLAGLGTAGEVFSLTPLSFDAGGGNINLEWTEVARSKRMTANTFFTMRAILRLAESKAEETGTIVRLTIDGFTDEGRSYILPLIDRARGRAKSVEFQIVPNL